MKIALTLTRPTKGELVAIATVSDGKPPEPKAGEMVRFDVDGGSVGTEASDSEGRASQKLSLAPGSHTVEAILVGTLNSARQNIAIEGEKKEGGKSGGEVIVGIAQRNGNHCLLSCQAVDGNKNPIKGKILRVLDPATGAYEYDLNDNGSAFHPFTFGTTDADKMRPLTFQVLGTAIVCPLRFYR